MALFRSLGARRDAARGTVAAEVRKGVGGLLTGPGVLPGSSSPLVQGTASFAYQVNAGTWATPGGSGGGLHLWGNDGPLEVGTDPAPAAGLSRIDVVYAVHPSASENGDTDSEPVVAVAKGTPASSPVAPSLPPRAIELARNTMTSAATSTASAGNTITQSAAVAALVQPPPGPHTPGVEVAVVSQSGNVDCAGTDQIVVAVSFTAQAGRKYRVEFDGSVYRQSNLSPRATTRLRWAAGSGITVGTGTVLATRLVDCVADSSVEQVRVVGTLTAGSNGQVTVGVHGSRTSGSGIITYSGGSGNTSTLRVTCAG